MSRSVDRACFVEPLSKLPRKAGLVPESSQNVIQNSDWINVASFLKRQRYSYLDVSYIMAFRNRLPRFISFIFIPFLTARHPLEVAVRIFQLFCGGEVQHRYLNLTYFFWWVCLKIGRGSTIDAFASQKLLSFPCFDSPDFQSTSECILQCVYQKWMRWRLVLGFNIEWLWVDLSMYFFVKKIPIFQELESWLPLQIELSKILLIFVFQQIFGDLSIIWSLFLLVFASGDLIQNVIFCWMIFSWIWSSMTFSHFVQDEVVIWLSKAIIPQEEHIEMHIWD